MFECMSIPWLWLLLVFDRNSIWRFVEAIDVYWSISFTVIWRQLGIHILSSKDFIWYFYLGVKGENGTQLLNHTYSSLFRSTFESFSWQIREKEVEEHRLFASKSFTPPGLTPLNWCSIDFKQQFEDFRALEEAREVYWDHFIGNDGLAAQTTLALACLCITASTFTPLAYFQMTRSDFSTSNSSPIACVLNKWIFGAKISTNL